MSTERPVCSFDYFDESCPEHAGKYPTPHIDGLTVTVPECTCGSPYIMTHAIWCAQFKFWEV